MRELSPLEKDAITELITIGIGAAAEALNELIGTHVRLTVPRVRVVNAEGLDLRELLVREGFASPSSQSVIVSQEFRGTPNGNVGLLLPHDSAARLVAELTGADLESPDLDAVKVGTLLEVGNIVMNAVIGTMTNLLDGNVSFGLPEFHEDALLALSPAVKSLGRGGVAVVAEMHFHIERLDVGGCLLLLLEVESLDAILAGLDRVLEGGRA
jgi:chemotaxis protein CheC